MFGVVFGWRKASKCKKVIKEAQCRLKLLKKKRQSIVKHLREDTANLIKFGYEAIALTRAEQLIKDESVAVAYELIDNFCDFIRTHFSYIRRHKECPDDINEAVSSLIYASARCGDLPELRVIRDLFEERYGHKLAMAAMELFPGNLVNQQIKEALNLQFVSDDMKHRMVNEIATDYCLQRRFLALEYNPEWQRQEAKESDERSVARVVLAGESSSESLSRFPEEAVMVYKDDIAEFPSPKDEDSRDQRVFKFKSPILSKRASSRKSIDLRFDDESSNSNGSQSSPRKRTRRRLAYPEMSRGIKDIECTSYYAQPQKYRHSTKKSPPEEGVRVTPLASNRRCYPKKQCLVNQGSDCESPSPLKQNEEMDWSHESGKDRACRYLRAETMPLERSKGGLKDDQFQRSNSLPVQEHPNHVHPKLPDYDDLTARFMAMKKEFLMNSNR